MDRRFAVIVRAYDDGVAFRYEIPPESKLDRFVIYHERTEFRFADDCRCWIGVPSSGGESRYPETRLSAIPCCGSNGVCRCALPLMAQTPTRCVAITEAGGTDWADMALCGTGGSAVRVVLSPHRDGCGCVSATAPHVSPWRVVLAVPDAAGLLDSDLIANLGHEDASGDRVPHLWKGGLTPLQTVTVPFTLGLLGAVDFSTDDVKGTHARRLALQAVCLGSSGVARDADENTLGREVPSVWDETVVLDAEIARHVAVARRSGETWWLVALNGETALRLRVPLRFLGEGAWTLRGCADVPDAGAAGGPRHPVERESTCSLTASDTLVLDLPPAGGYAAVLSRP